MRKKIKITIALLLVLCLVLPIGALAAEGGVWQIDTAPDITGPRDLATDNEWEALIQINALRLSNGQSPLAMARDLQPLATLRSRELEETFGSARPNDAPWYTVLDEREIAYYGAAELIASNFVSGPAVVAEWADNEETLAILLGDFTHIGIGHNFRADTWSVLFVSGAAHTELSLHRSGLWHLPAGETLSDQRLMIAADGPMGLGFFPLVDEMVTGFSRNQAGLQEITFSLGGLSTDFTLEVLFGDVRYESWYLDYIRFVTQNGLFHGISESEFGPEHTMTRAMFVTVLGRLAEQMGLEITGDHSGFADVQDDAWYTRYIGWAADRGIAQGFGDVFGVTDPVTREQMATFLLRFVHYIELELTPGPGRAPLITDRLEISAWAREAVDLFVSLGVIDLDGATRAFAPREDATRAVVAKAITVLARDFA